MSEGVMPDEDRRGAAPVAPPRALREPVLDQHEIDAVSGFRPVEPGPEPTGARGMVGAGAGPREPLPMLAVAFDDVAQRLTSSLRTLFAGDAAVTVASLGPQRYGDVVEDVVLPAQIVTFRADGWDGDGLVAIGPDFAILVLDSLLGGGAQTAPVRAASRPFSGIETAILTRIADLVLAAATEAFRAIVPVSFRRDRLESDPRLAAVARSGDVAFVATFALGLGGRSARFSFLLPSATLDTVRNHLRSDFMGVKLGRDDYWSGHLATEVWRAPIEAEAVLHETALPLRQVMALAVGDTLMFDMKPSDLVEVRCGGLVVTRGRMGRVEGRIAVQVVEPVSRPRPSGREARAA